MKKNVSTIILGIVIVGILGLIIYTIFIREKTEAQKYNISEGQVIDFNEYNVSVTVKNVTKIKCLKNDRKCKEQIEVSLSAKYNNIISYYTLKSIDKPQELIKNSNYYVILDYKDGKIIIDVKDKKELNKTE